MVFKRLLPAGHANPARRRGPAELHPVRRVQAFEPRAHHPETQSAVVALASVPDLPDLQDRYDDQRKFVEKAFVVPFIDAGDADVAELHRAWLREHRRLTGSKKA